MHTDERRAARALLGRLSRTSLGERLILAGSSGLYTASETIPALTEDLDFLVDADWAATHEAELLAELEKLGFRHQPGSSTFTAKDGTSLDLVGYSIEEGGDRIGGGKTVPLMVYGDLSRLLRSPRATVSVPSQGRALTAAALAAVKLLTVRLEKGGKDKLQALLLINENAGDTRFAADLRELLGRFDADRIEDAMADAQAAFLAVSADPLRADPQSKGYAGLNSCLEGGLRSLQRLLGLGESA